MLRGKGSHLMRRPIVGFVQRSGHRPNLAMGSILLSTNGIKATGFQPVRFSVMYYNLPSHF